MAELVFEPAHLMAQRIASRQVSCEELMRAHLDRIQAVNPVLNAIVELQAEESLAAARRMDSHLSQERSVLPPFYGVPMTVKGAWDCHGFRNTGGTLGRKDFFPKADATVIARMRGAGMIPIGITNLPEFSLAFESDNLIWGRTNNPYDLSRTPGGSGGGGAAAIASGCSPFEVGADLGGSIRLPAHFSGIAGLKPTLGRVPLSGYFPGPFGVVTLCATAGPMARKVRDLALTYPLLSGPDGQDANVALAEIHSPEEVQIKDLRIAFHTHNGIHEVTSPVRTTVIEAAKAIYSVAGGVEEDQPEGLAESFEIFMGLLAADGGAGLEQLAAHSDTTEYSPLFRGFCDVVKPMAMSSAQFGGLLVRRDLYRMRVASFFEKYDALICPVNSFPALPHGESVPNLAAFSYTIAHNLSGCPAVVVRCGTSPEGLPIGVQVVARAWHEHVALRVAEVLEHECGGWRRPEL